MIDYGTVKSKRMIVNITVPDESEWNVKEMYVEVEADIREVMDYYDVLVEIQ